MLSPVSVISRFAAIPSQIEGLYGSIWHGRAVLSGGHDLSWEAEPGALLAARLEAPFTLAGPGTRLTGTVRLGLGGVEILDLAGRVGPGILAFADGMPEIACTARGIVDVPRLFAARSVLLGGQGPLAAQGSLRVEAGTCTEASGRVTEVPGMELLLTTDAADARARLISGETLLLTLVLRGSRRMALRIEPDGAALVPGLPTGGPIELDYPF